MFTSTTVSNRHKNIYQLIKIINNNNMWICWMICPKNMRVSKVYHRVDRVIESSVWEIIRSKYFALINLSLICCEKTINDNTVILENLVPVH